MKSVSDNNHLLVILARKAIESCLAEKPLPDAADKSGLGEPAGVFVSIKKKGRLRGCIGTIQPVYPTLVEEVVNNAVSAATRDPRFPPLSEEELGDITISVDVLTPPEPVSSLEELDPARYGIIVQKGIRKGVLLPDLPGVDKVEQQVEIAMNKAGLAPGEEVQLFRFEVKRYY
jgi:AmmeMemoRadiSam system protein A